MTDAPIRSVIVVGRTGSGKSELVKRLILSASDKENTTLPTVSSGFASCTKKAEGYMLPGTLGTGRYQLIDTMGMLDSKLEDEKGIEGLARLVDKLLTTVGVIYVVSGKMDPSEADICEFLFNTFFHDVPANRVLVLKTKCSDWQTYDVEQEKEGLRQQGNVPDRILNANCVPVDFHPYTPPDLIDEMTTKIRRHLASWTTYLDLSEKLDTAMEYVPHYKQVEEAKKALEDATCQMEQQKMERTRLEERLHEFEKLSAEDRRAHKKEIDELHQQLIDSKRGGSNMEVLVENMMKQHAEQLRAMQDSMSRMQRGSVCPLM